MANYPKPQNTRADGWPPGIMREWHYDDLEITLQSGTEMGRFLLGSTVVMLFPQGALEFNPAWHPTKPLRMGEATGSLAAPSP